MVKQKQLTSLTGTNPMIVKLIVAMNNKGFIWKDNALLWKNKYEMAFFKKMTEWHAVIMGRKTFQSIGHTLPNRKNFIITGSVNWTTEQEYDFSWVTIFSSVWEALSSLIVSAQPPPVVFFIWGAQIYNTAVANRFVDEIIVSVVDDDQNGDVSFVDMNHYPDYEVYKTDYSNKIYGFYNIYYRRKWA